MKRILFLLAGSLTLFCQGLFSEPNLISQNSPPFPMVVSLRKTSELSEIWQYDLYFIAPGKFEKQLTDLKGFEGGVLFLSPSRFLFSHSPDMKDWDLLECDLESGMIKNFLATPELIEGKADLHPNQQVLIYTRKDPGFPFSLFLYHLKTQTHQLFARMEGDLLHPVFSPKGDWVVGVLARGKNMDLVKIETVSGSIHFLTESEEYRDRDPIFSPKGDQVLFTRKAEKGSDIFSISLQSGELINLTPDDPWDRLPQFLGPDSILYLSTFFGHQGCYQFNLKTKVIHPFFTPGHSIGGIHPVPTH